MLRAWIHRSVRRRQAVNGVTVTLSLAAYLVAATLGGWLHVHTHDHEHGGAKHSSSVGHAHAHAHFGPARHFHRSPATHEHRHYHAGHDDSGQEHAGHSHGPAGQNAPKKAPANPLHDDDCAACQFAAERVMPAAPVAIVAHAPLCQVLVDAPLPAPLDIARQRPQARAPPQAG